MNIRYTLDNERIKEDIVLAKAPTEAPEYTFVFNLRGLRAVQQPNNAIQLLDAKEQIRFTIPAPYMFDSAAASGKGVPTSSDIAVKLSDLGDSRVQVTLLPDMKWLSDPERVYPVTIDPTIDTEVGGQAQTASVTQWNPTSNLGYAEVSKDAAGNRRDALVQFHAFDALPKDSAVLSAQLQFSSSWGLPVTMQEVTQLWNASTVTWNTAPPANFVANLTLSTPTTTIDITKIVQKWVSGEAPNHGLRFLSQGPNNSGATLSNFSLSITYVQANRMGLHRQWSYNSQDYGAGNSSSVNLSSGNMVYQHRNGAIPALGFDVDVTHTYNGQDPDNGSAFGEGWTISQYMRLQEISGGNGVVFYDGSRGTQQVYIKDADTSTTRSYRTSLSYDYKLEKTLSNPPANCVFKLTADVGAETLCFDAQGALTQRKNRNNNTLSYAYSSGRLSTITDSAGRTTSFTYTNNRLSRLTDMAGRMTDYGYDTGGNLTTITHGVSTATTYVTTLGYGVLDLLTSTRSPRNYRSDFGYQILDNWETAGNTGGWVDDSKEPNGATPSQSTTQKYIGNGALKVTLSQVDNFDYGRVVRNFSPAQQLSSVPQSMVVFVYVPAGGPALNASIHLWFAETSNEFGQDTYSAALTAGQWNAITFGGAHLEKGYAVSRIGLQFTTNAFQTYYNGNIYVDHLFIKGVTTSITDARANHDTLVKYEYDWANSQTKVVRPDKNGSFATTNATIFTHTYDGAGRVTSVLDPAGKTTTRNIDELGRVFEQTLPGATSGGYLYTTSYYPNSNQIKSVTNNQGETVRRGANGQGDTTYLLNPLDSYRSSTNQAYQGAAFTRDTAGNLTNVATRQYPLGYDIDTQGIGGGTMLRDAEFLYTSNGLVQQMTDPRGKITTFEYDNGANNKGYLTKITAPAGQGESNARVTTIVRNADGSVQKVTDPKNLVTTYEYDTIGRLTKINYSVVGSVAAFSFTYTLDKNGNLTAMNESAGNSNWGYNEDNRMTQEIRSQNATTKTATYEYFVNGELKKIVNYNGSSVNFDYDNFLRVKSISDPENGSSLVLLGYNERGYRNKITYPSGVFEEVVFDLGDRVQSIVLKKGTTTLQSFTYNYDWNSTTELPGPNYANGSVWTVTESSGAVTTYGYDQYNRLISASRTGSGAYTEGYGYDDSNNRTSITTNGVTKSATYDDANQMITFDGVTHLYDRNGNLTSYGSNTLVYNDANKWTSGTISGTSLTFEYDALGRRSAYKVNATRTDSWYDMTGLVLETGGVNGGRTLRTLDGTPLSRKTGTTLVNYGRDRLGSITALTSTSGTLSGSYTYRPYGDLQASTGSVVNPLRYAGTYFDSTTGWYLMGARYYQTNAGRFTQLDPLPSSITDINRYAYVNCNPINAVDPTGLEEEPNCNNFEKAESIALGLLTTAATAVAVAAVPLSGPGIPLAAAGAAVAFGFEVAATARAIYCFSDLYE